jgi:hypothetical protein
MARGIWVLGLDVSSPSEGQEAVDGGLGDRADPAAVRQGEEVPGERLARRAVAEDHLDEDHDAEDRHQDRSDDLGGEQRAGDDPDLHERDRRDAQ